MKKKTLLVCVIEDKNLDRFAVLEIALKGILAGSKLKLICIDTFINTDSQDLEDAGLLVSTISSPLSFEEHQREFLKKKRVILLHDGTASDEYRALIFAEKYPKCYVTSAQELNTNDIRCLVIQGLKKVVLG